jgi:hypothetical protein
MRMGWRMGCVGVLGVGLLVLAACGENTGTAPGQRSSAGAQPDFYLGYLSDETPTPIPRAPEPTPTPAPSRLPPNAVASGAVKFTPCRATPAEAGASNLSPGTIPSAEPRPVSWDVRPYGGRLTVEYVMKLPLPGGWLGSGAAYDAAYATTQEVALADHDVTADVYFGVIGRRVAFVELRLAKEKPVRWAAEPGLDIVTDGGDGGFFSGTAGSGPENPDFEDYIDAFQEHVKAPNSNLCVLRRNEDQPQPTGFLFHTGVGDGGYPTYVGRNARGEIVSVVNDGLLVPWALSGLPGSPPPEVARAVADRRAQPR